MNKQNVKKVLGLILHSTFRELIYISNCKILHWNILITVDKTCEEVLRLTVDFNNKVKVEKFHSKLKSHITKQLLTSISVDMRIYLPLKVIFTSA